MSGAYGHGRGNGVRPRRRTSKDGGALPGQQAFALQALALQLAEAADGLGPLARPLFARLLVMATELHLAEDALTLHLLLQRLQRLVDVVVANDDLQRLLRFLKGRRELAQRLFPVYHRLARLISWAGGAPAVAGSTGDGRGGHGGRDRD